MSRELGLDVSLAGLRHLRPGVVLYEGFELADPETDETVLRCRLLETARKHTTDQQGRRKSLLVLTASQPEIEAAGLDRLEQLLRRLLQRRTGTMNLDVQLTAGELTLKADKYSQTLTELRGSIETLPAGTQAQLSFRLAGIDMREPMRIRIARNRQTTPPVTGFELDTGGVAVPCSMLAMGLRAFQPLGPRARLHGYIWANQTPDGWDAEVTGELFEVDLGSLVTERFPHKLSGTGQVTIQSARFHGGRLVAASGILAAGPGVISRSLIDAAVGQLKLSPGAEPPTPGELVPYEQLALVFILDAQGLTLYGRCTATAPGAILVDRNGRLLGEPVVQPQPVVALLQMLVPQSELQVPATRQTDWLMRYLPVPQVVRRKAAKATLPHARVRLGRTKR